MAENTKISWAHHTFNPWEGCQKAGPGCDNCYAEARNARFGGGTAPNWGPGAPRRRTSPANWRKPIAWDADAKARGIRYRVFCASLADVFDNQVPPEWRVQLLELIAATPNLDWLLLTKRIGNVKALLLEAEHHAMNTDRLDLAGWLAHWPPPNVWLGATVVNQEEADRDIPKLLATPARVRFLSMEPLLGPVDLRSHLYECCGCPVEDTGGEYMGQRETMRSCCGNFEGTGLHWVIVGGESGRGARPMHPDWARNLRDQCRAAGVPFHFKQWGEWLGQGQDGAPDAPGGQHLNGSDGSIRIGNAAAGNLLDGEVIQQVPEVR